MNYALKILLLAIFLYGCAMSETVYLQNAEGELVQCGPYTNYGNIPNAVDSTRTQLRDCVGDYQRQGYERVPEPTNE